MLIVFVEDPASLILIGSSSGHSLSPECDPCLQRLSIAGCRILRIGGKPGIASQRAIRMGSLVFILCSHQVVLLPVSRNGREKGKTVSFFAEWQNSRSGSSELSLKPRPQVIGDPVAFQLRITIMQDMDSLFVYLHFLKFMEERIENSFIITGIIQGLGNQFYAEGIRFLQGIVLCDPYQRIRIRPFLLQDRSNISIFNSSWVETPFSGRENGQRSLFVIFRLRSGIRSETRPKKRNTISSRRKIRIGFITPQEMILIAGLAVDQDKSWLFLFCRRMTSRFLSRKQEKLLSYPQ